MRKPVLHSVALVAAAAFVFGATVPEAQAQTGQANYDGYCYAKDDHSTRDDALRGAAIGGAIGALFGKKNKKVKSAVVGAAVGAAAGYVVAKSSKEKIHCSDNRYYVYTGNYYDPAPAASGYRVVFFEARPSDVDLYVRTSHGDERYRGY